MKRTAALTIAGLAFGGALLAAPGATAATTTATTISTCTYSYSVQSQWSGGFTAQLTVDYSLGAESSGWAVGFDFVSPTQHVTTSWDASISQYGSHVTATQSPYAPPAPLPQSGSVTVAFIGSFTTADPSPVNVTFDGIACSSYSWNV